MKKFFKRRITIAVLMVLVMFLVTFISVSIVGVFVALLFKLGAIVLDNRPFPLFYLAVMMMTVILLATLLSALMSKRTVRPFKELINANQQVAKGNFAVRMEKTEIDEIDVLAASFNTMVQELSGIETLRSDFVNNFSHEFKTPIVSIRGFAKLLKEGNLSPEEQEEYLNIIIEESERLTQLSTNVLNLSKIENIEIVGDRENFLLDEQIRRAVLLLEPKWTAKNVQVNLHLERVQIYSNETLLQQIWINLLENAIKFSEQGGKIRVGLNIKDEQAVFSIQDNGCGMDADTVGRIFDKFYQGDTSHSVAGNGLGLTLVNRIVTLCEGTVAVESELEKGSTFFVTLPLK